MCPDKPIVRRPRGPVESFSSPEEAVRHAVVSFYPWLFPSEVLEAHGITEGDLRELARDAADPNARFIG